MFIAWGAPQGTARHHQRSPEEHPPAAIAIVWCAVGNCISDRMLSKLWLKLDICHSRTSLAAQKKEGRSPL
jgi:hypothetical protein